VAQFACVPGDLAGNVQRIAELSETARDQEADLLVLPELSLTGYTVGDRFERLTLRLDESSRTLADIQRLSQEVGLAVGFVEETPDARLYNSVGLWHRGELLGLHRKVYPPNYGRFDEGKWFCHGRCIRAFDTPWGRLAMLVCADAWHPALPYLAAHDGADVLLYMAASAQGAVSEEADTLGDWHRLNRTHALTLSAYVAFANCCGVENDRRFTGGSQIVAPSGRPRITMEDRAGVAVADVSAAALRAQRMTMPFRRDDDLRLTEHLAGVIAQRAKARGGLSDVIDSANTLSARAQADEDEAVIARIDPRRERDQPHAQRI